MALDVTLLFPRSELAGLTPLRLELSDAISACFELVLDVESTDHSIDMQAIVGERIVVGLNGESLLPEIEGFVRRVDQLTSEPTGQSQYRLFVVPPVWLSTRRRDHRIFKDLSVPEIVAAVLAGYAGRIEPPTLALSTDHPKREYTVQYGETDHDFILRLLADEGIASFFDHGSHSAWTLVDDTTVFTPAITTQIPFLPFSSLTDSGPLVSAVSVRTEVDTSEVALRDYDFEKPEIILQAKATTTGDLFSNEGALESYEFEVGNFSRQPEADARAQQILQETRTHHRVLRCETNFALGAGSRLLLVDHPRTDVDGELLVIRAQTVLDARDTPTTTRHFLECIDGGRFFRPARRPKPRIFGTQTAVVVGAPGEEIDVDRFGRVEVQFRWDRRDLHTQGASRRVRVSQGWAGAAFGFVLLPRVNEEVIVAYLDGDPDEPMIVGRVHNAFVVNPLNLPAEKTQSVWRSRSSPGGNGFNEIRMEDAAGSELLSVHAQRDLREVIEHDRTVKVGNDDITLAKKKHTVAVPHSQGLTTLVTTDQKIVLDTGAGATITMEGDKITLAAKTIELLGTQGIGLHAPAGGTSVSGPDFIVTGDKFAVGVNSTATINAPDVNLGGATVNIAASGTLDVAGTPVQINGPGPFAGRVTELAPAMITTGVALVLIGGASFPLPVEKLPNGDLKIGNSIVVEGDAAFQSKVLTRLGVISSTPAGQDLLGKLDASGKTMTITEFKGDDSWAEPDNIVAATAKGLPVFDAAGNPRFGPDGRQLVGTGDGSNVTVAFNPELTLPNSRDPAHPMPNDSVLFHEMTHGKHDMTGTLDGTPDPVFDNNEERQTILGGNPSEADYNKQRGYRFHRIDHNLTFVLN